MLPLNLKIKNKTIKLENVKFVLYFTQILSFLEKETNRLLFSDTYFSLFFLIFLIFLILGYWENKNVAEKNKKKGYFAT